MGSPEFALPSLRKLAIHYPIVGVVTQPDRPAGRGRVMTPPPVKTLASELGIEVIQPERMREPEAQEKLRDWAPDLIIVTAFGQILRKNILNLPQYGCINVHASLLPRWRGAAPIQAAILHGDTTSGTTIMQLDPGIDTGPILAQEEIEIFPEDTAGSLSERLATAGADLLIRVLPGYLNGSILPQPQNESLATYAPMLQKEEGLLDFTKPAIELERLIHAFNPWPSAFIPWQEGVLKIHHAHVDHSITGEIGKRIVFKDWPAVVTVSGGLILNEVQPAGKKPMSGRDFLRGARQWPD